MKKITTTKMMKKMIGTPCLMMKLRVVRKIMMMNNMRPKLVSRKKEVTIL